MTRRTVLYAIPGAILLATAAWSYGFMADHRRAALKARADAEECRQIAARIQALQERPAMACDQERLAAEMIGLTEQAARSAGIRADGLVRIIPEPPRRLEETAYREKPTNVLLRNVTLRQLVGMVYKLVEGKEGLSPKSIRLSAPRADSTGELWTAEVVLTYLIYDPPRSEK